MGLQVAHAPPKVLRQHVEDLAEFGQVWRPAEDLEEAGDVPEVGDAVGVGDAQQAVHRRIAV